MFLICTLCGNYNRAMTLDDWLIRTCTKEEAFAALIGVSQASVNRYRHGLRVPRPAVLARIGKATAGAVTANDFMGTVAGR